MRGFVRSVKTSLVVMAAASCLALPARAQPTAARAAVAADSPGALVIESLGGSAGALVGIGAIALLHRCGFDDLGCEILTAGAAGIAGVAGATAGTLIAARLTGSRRSAAGAVLGGVVGTAAGLGLHYLLNSNSDRNLDSAEVIPLFAISQGVFSALGSRFIGAAKGMR